MTLEEMMVDIKSRLSELDSGSFVSDRDIVNWINEALSDIASKTRYLTESAHMTTLEGLDRYYLPDDFIEEFRVFFNGRKVEEITFEERGEKPGYIVWARNIIVSPMPPDESKIEIEYYRKHETLDVDDQTKKLELPGHHTHLLVSYVLSRAFKKERMVERSQAEYEEYLQNVQLMRTEFARAPRRRRIGVKRR